MKKFVLSIVLLLATAFAHAQTFTTNNLQVNGTESVVGQSKSGNGTAPFPAYTFTNDPTTGAYLPAAGDYRLSTAGVDSLRLTTGDVILTPAGYLGWGSIGVTAADTQLYRDAANTLALRNATNAQAFNIYNTYTNASNYERLAIAWTSNVAMITSGAAGTGTVRALGLGTGGVSRIVLPTSNPGAILPGADNGYSLGNSATHFTNLYASQSLINNGTVVATPTTGTSVTIASATNLELVTPAGLLAALTIVFPVPLADGDTREIVITQSITALTLTPTSPATAIVDGSIASVTTYGVYRFRYVAASTTWYLVP